MIVLCIYLGFKFISLLENLNEKDFYLEKQENKIEHKDNIIAKLRSQKHDYLKHLQVVFSLINTDLTDDAKVYIKNISDNFKTQKSRYGNVSYIDAIAALKYEECLLKNIKFDMYTQDFIDNLSISPNEMSSVLINIIDNAIDALSTVPKDNKYIKIKMNFNTLYLLKIMVLRFTILRVFLKRGSLQKMEKIGVTACSQLKIF